MFKPNSRTQKENGVKFFEQDVLSSEYVFTGDIIIDMNIDYQYPGFGIILAADNGKDFNYSDHVHLFKLGYNDFSVIERHFLEQTNPVHTSCPFEASDANLGAHLVFKKQGKIVTLEHITFNTSGVEYISLLGKYELSFDVEKYKIGFYSNAGNIVHTASVASGMPSNWIVNIQNTNGGRISFFKNGFFIENCEYDAEIEQQEIELEAGTYYVDYKTEFTNNYNDIECFVFYSSDKSFDDDKKNIMQKDGKITLEEANKINIKFKGTSGKISEIAIKDFINESFVETGSEAITLEGSCIKVDLNNVSQIDWTGTIYEVPEYTDYENPPPYAVVETITQRTVLPDAKLSLNKEYSYKFVTEEKKLYITNNESFSETLDIKLYEIDNKILTIFYNMNAEIRELILTYEDGTVINILLQKTFKKYVPSSITSPILVTNKKNEPLEISAAYRVVISDNEDELEYYLFTNYEREVFFDTESRIFLEKPVADVSGAVIVYGIPYSATINMNNIYAIPNKMMINSIDLVTNKYDLLSETSYEFSHSTLEVMIKEEYIDQYQAFIIDYLKNENYCINYLEDYGQYEIDIATDEKELWISYEMNEDGSFSDYHITNIKPDKNKYIVLRRKAS